MRDNEGVPELTHIEQPDAVRTNDVAVKIQAKQVCTVPADVIANELPIGVIGGDDVLDFEACGDGFVTDRALTLDGVRLVFFDSDLFDNVGAVTVSCVIFDYIIFHLFLPPGV